MAETVSAQQVSSLYFFGDSLTDEGRAGRSAPVIWAQVLRNDLSITSGQNFAIAGTTSGNQASATFGNAGFLGQVNSFVAGAPYTNAAAGVWTGTNDIQLGSIAHIPAATIAATASQNVRTGLAAIGGAGVGTVALLGVYDLSLTNAYEFAGAGTPAVRGNAAQASQLYNAQLTSLAVPGVAIRYYDIANFINQLQVNARAYGFTQILPLQPGQTCGRPRVSPAGPEHRGMRLHVTARLNQRRQVHGRAVPPRHQERCCRVDGDVRPPFTYPES